MHYRTAGPVDASGPPVMFVHGVLVDGSLWSATADALAAHGVRSFAPDLPLGSHRSPVHPDADQSPRGVARQIIAFIEALELDDVTLVGNDSGGAICQYVLDTDPSRDRAAGADELRRLRELPAAIVAPLHDAAAPSGGDRRGGPGDALRPASATASSGSGRSPAATTRT